jgi:hypothetical protein
MGSEGEGEFHGSIATVVSGICLLVLSSLEIARRLHLLRSVHELTDITIIIFLYLVKFALIHFN